MATEKSPLDPSAVMYRLSRQIFITRSYLPYSTIPRRRFPKSLFCSKSVFFIYLNISEIKKFEQKRSLIVFFKNIHQIFGELDAILFELEHQSPRFFAFVFLFKFEKSIANDRPVLFKLNQILDREFFSSTVALESF